MQKLGHTARNILVNQTAEAITALNTLKGSENWSRRTRIFVSQPAQTIASHDPSNGTPKDRELVSQHQNLKILKVP